MYSFATCFWFWKKNGIMSVSMNCLDMWHSGSLIFTAAWYLTLWICHFHLLMTIFALVMLLWTCLFISLYVYGWEFFYFIYHLGVDFLGCGVYSIFNCFQTIYTPAIIYKSFLWSTSWQYLVLSDTLTLPSPVRGV